MKSSLGSIAIFVIFFSVSFFAEAFVPFMLNSGDRATTIIPCALSSLSSRPIRIRDAVNIFYRQPNQLHAAEASSTAGDAVEVSQSEVPELTLDDEEWKVIDDLWARSSPKDDNCDETVLQDLLVKLLPTLNPHLVYKLRTKATSPTSSNEDADRETKLNVVSKILDGVINSQLENARNVLSNLLNAGEVRKLDAEIGKAAKQGQLDMSFFTVLNMNMQDAQQEELQRQQQATVEEDVENVDDNIDEDNNNTNASRLQILQHIYTRCQEEVEKLVPPGTALLNKLLRTEVDSIRKNQLEHYLCPQKNVIKSPDGKEIQLSSEKPVVLVQPTEFIDAIADAVKQIRTVEQAGATTRESAAIMVESCRQVAKEARIVIGESYGIDSTTLRDFEDGLMPVFRPSSPQSPYIKGN